VGRVDLELPDFCWLQKTTIKSPKSLLGPDYISSSAKEQMEGDSWFARSLITYMT